MCGRYTLGTPVADLEARFNADFGAFEPSYNCAPGQALPVIPADDPTETRQMKWGLTPSWANESFDLINARAETVRKKRSFADAFERRRCLVPADGFYEWAAAVDRSDSDSTASDSDSIASDSDTLRGDGGKTRPYRVAFEDDRAFAMAGLYERWEPPTPETTQTGLGAFGGGSSDTTDEPDETDTVETFTIITTTPNALISELHHRMAVILPPDEEQTWLHGTLADAESLLKPYPAAELTAYPVSTRVNSPAIDSPSLIDPIGDAAGP